MDIKIKYNGQLFVKRGKEYVMQVCPITPRVIPCGDWCPLFNLENNILSLCHKEYKVNSVIDERPKEEVKDSEIN